MLKRVLRKKSHLSTQNMVDLFIPKIGRGIQSELQAIADPDDGLAIHLSEP